MRSNRKEISLIGNVIYQSLYQVMAVLVPLVTAPYVSRVLGAEKTGVFSVVNAVANYFVVFSMLGINNYGSRKISQLRGDKRATSESFFSIYLFHVLLTIVMLGLYYLYSYKFILSEYRGPAMAASVFVWSSLFDIQWFFAGKERFKMTAGFSTISKIACAICIFAFVKRPEDVTKYTLIMALSHMATNLLPWIYLKNEIVFPKIVSRKMNIRQHIMPCLIFFIPVIAITVYRYIGKILLGNMSTMTEAGLYENADRVTQIVLGIIGGIGYVMQQRMSNLYANRNSEKDASKLLDFSFMLTGFISCALSFGLSGIANVLAPVYFGEDFRSCNILISFLSLEIVYVSFANVVRTNYLIPKEKDKEYVASVVVGAIVNVGANLILIPIYGALGAVIAVMCADMSVFVLQTFAVRKELPLGKYLGMYGGFGVIGILMWLCVRFMGSYMKESVFTLVLQITAGGIVYCLLSYVFVNTFQWHAISSIKQVVFRRK